MDGKGIQPVEQIGAEFTLFNGIQKIFVGRRDYRYVYGHFLFSPDLPDCPLLQHAQNFALKVGFHLPYLVEEDGSPSCGFKNTFFICLRVGEGAFRVAEELALQEGLGKCRTIDADKGCLPRRKS